MKNYKIVIVQCSICALLSLFGIVNWFVLIWMANKMRYKQLKLIGFGCIGAFVFSMTIFSFSADAGSMLLFLSSLMPCYFILANLSEYKRRISILLAIQEYKIRVDVLKADAVTENEISYIPKEFRKSSEGLFESKGAVVLYEIDFHIKDEEKRSSAYFNNTRLATNSKEQTRIDQEVREKKMEEELKAEHSKAIILSEQAKIEQAKAEQAKAAAIVEQAKVEQARVAAQAKGVEEKEQAIRKDESATVAEHRLVDINVCEEMELAQIAGIGMILAKKAMDIRNTKGPFSSVDEFILLIGIREYNTSKVRSCLTCSQNTKMDSIARSRTQGRRIDL